MHPKRRFALTVILLATVAAFVLAYRWNDRARTPVSNASSEKPIAVRSGIAEVRNVPEVYSTSGFVTPLNVVEIRPQVTATVRSVDIKEGQMVRLGQRIFTLDDRSDAANVQKAGAQVVRDQALLDDAKRALARNIDLKARGFVSPSTVDSAQSSLLVRGQNGRRWAVINWRGTQSKRPLLRPIGRNLNGRFLRFQ